MYKKILLITGISIFATSVEAAGAAAARAKAKLEAEAREAAAEAEAAATTGDAVGARAATARVEALYAKHGGAISVSAELARARAAVAAAGGLPGAPAPAVVAGGGMPTGGAPAPVAAPMAPRLARPAAPRSVTPPPASTSTVATPATVAPEGASTSTVATPATVAPEGAPVSPRRGRRSASPSPAPIAAPAMAGAGAPVTPTPDSGSIDRASASSALSGLLSRRTGALPAPADARVKSTSTGDVAGGVHFTDEELRQIEAGEIDFRTLLAEKRGGTPARRTGPAIPAELAAIGAEKLEGFDKIKLDRLVKQVGEITEEQKLDLGKLTAADLDLIRRGAHVGRVVMQYAKAPEITIRGGFAKKFDTVRTNVTPEAKGGAGTAKATAEAVDYTPTKRDPGFKDRLASAFSGKK